MRFEKKYGEGKVRRKKKEERRKKMTIVLNPDQKYAFDLMSKGENVFITGSGGCGKSLLMNEFIKKYKSGVNIAVTSTTGTSALLLMGGTTLHSWAGIGLGTGSCGSLVTKIRKKPWLRKRWNQVSTLIIDEVSMLDPVLFDKLDIIGKTLRLNDKPFGGIQIICTGDFLQLPCVKTELFCFESESWKRTIKHTIYLTENMRQMDPVWRGCLEEIRLGKMSDSTRDILLGLEGKALECKNGIIPTMLFPLNADVDQVNYTELEKISQKTGEICEYNLEFSIYDKKQKYKADKFIRDCPAVEQLHLCRGCQVILLWNLDIESGLVNGSRGVVTNFIKDIPLVRFLNGTTRLVDYHIWELEENDTKLASFEQIPLRLGYAFSIHRAQGCSLDYVIADLEDVFEYGQGYVALSRARNLEGLSLRGLNIKKIKAHPSAVVFYESLKDKDKEDVVEDKT